MFRDIFTGKNSLFSAPFSDLSETSLEMHYITRTGSLEIGDNAVDFDEDEDESHWNEANMSFLKF